MSTLPLILKPLGLLAFVFFASGLRWLIAKMPDGWLKRELLKPRSFRRHP